MLTIDPLQTFLSTIILVAACITRYVPCISYIRSVIVNAVNNYLYCTAEVDYLMTIMA